MKTIYKYELQIEDEQNIPMPVGSKIVHVGLDPRGVSCIWAEVETENPVENVNFHIIGTGHPLPNELVHVGSFVQGPIVWHLNK